MKKKTYKSIQKEADKVMSWWVRLSRANEFGLCECYTCGNWYAFGNMDNGHYIGRRYYHRYSEDNTRPQCPRCNRYEEGNKTIFRRKLIEELGENKVVYMETTKNKNLKKGDIEYYLSLYTEMLKELLPKIKFPLPENVKKWAKKNGVEL